MLRRSWALLDWLVVHFTNDPWEHWSVQMGEQNLHNGGTADDCNSASNADYGRGRAGDITQILSTVGQGNRQADATLNPFSRIF